MKHFPCIGSGEVDSHAAIPVVRLNHADLMAQDLAPYIELFQRRDDRIRCVMVSHGGFPNIDILREVKGGTIVPASLNAEIVTKLLREELGYKHLVMTDDLEMGAIARHYTIEEAVVQAFLAGEDMLAICAHPELIRRGFQAIIEAVRNGTIKKDRLHASLRRIAAFKTLIQPALPLDLERFNALSGQIAQLNQKLNYVYGGSR